ncbi:MAG: hypothetical protein HFH02_01895 [Dorea sp.]|nr:hypothetical protein [Dorea sp.]
MEKYSKGLKEKVFSFICYLINIIAIFYPWIVIGNTKYNFLQLKSKIADAGINEMVKQSGMMVDNPEFVWFCIKIQIIIYFLFLLLCFGYIFTLLIGRNWRLNLAAFYMSIAIMIFNTTGYSIASLCTNTIQGFVFPLISVAITVLELLVSKMISQKESIKKKF